MILEEAGPCHLLDFGHLASRTVKQLISVALRYLVCGNLLQQSSETNRVGDLLSQFLNTRIAEFY